MKTIQSTAGLLLVLTLCVGCDRQITSSVSSAAPFDQTAWLEGEKAAFSPDAPRLGMADGLVSSHALLGKKRRDVEAMLGPETDTSKFQNYDLVYWLGAERGYMPIDSEWLVVKFDERGEVSDARIVRD